MKINLDRLTELAEKSTPGPWRHYDIFGDDCEYGEVFGPKAGLSGDKLVLGSRDDAAFIAAMSPQTALALIRIARASEQIYNLLPWDFGHCESVKELEKALKVLE